MHITYLLHKFNQEISPSKRKRLILQGQVLNPVPCLRNKFFIDVRNDKTRLEVCGFPFSGFEAILVFDFSSFISHHRYFHVLTPNLVALSNCHRACFINSAFNIQSPPESLRTSPMYFSMCIKDMKTNTRVWSIPHIMTLSKVKGEYVHCHLGIVAFCSKSFNGLGDDRECRPRIGYLARIDLVRVGVNPQFDLYQYCIYGRSADKCRLC